MSQKLRQHLGREPRVTGWSYAGLFLVTLATLVYEIALTRIFSVTMWYHFAFVAISVALFGMTVGALLVHLRPSWFTDDRLERNMWLCSLGFGVSVALAFLSQLTVPFEPEVTVNGFWSVLTICSVVSVPFIFSGIVVCLALTRFPRRVNRLYAADLVGAALGCVVLVWLFSWLDGPSAVIATGALGALAAVAFAASSSLPRAGRLAVAGLAVLVLGSGALVNGAMADDGEAPVRIVWAKQQRREQPQYSTWNAFSNVTVGGDAGAVTPPEGFGFSPNMPADFRVRNLGMVIDSTAGTELLGYTGDESETDFLRWDISNLAHGMRPDGDVLVVGVGGGRDILSALEFDQRSVTGVEINGDILRVTNDVYGDFTGNLDEHPKVDFHRAEARSWLTRNDEKFDIIQISLIDTWAASGAGAYALSENSLYTTEAWANFFDHLRPNGVLSVSRWFDLPGSSGPLETYRTVSLAAEALTRRGVENPRDHILVYKSPTAGPGVSIGTVMVSPEPFSAGDLERMGERNQRLGFTPVLTPEVATDERFAALAQSGGPGPALDRFAVDVSPPTDDRPFFFQMAGVGTLFSDEVALTGQSVEPVLVLGLLGLVVVVLAAACIGLPLGLDRRSRRGLRRNQLGFLTFFAGIGFGFMLVEVAMLQRLSIFLGHPTYGLTVVLFSVLLFSGIGSMLIERYLDPSRPRSMVAPLCVLVAVAAVVGLVTPAILDAAEGLATPARLATAVALLAPLGLTMGMPFSIGMRAASSRPGTPTAFLWGVNGATSVCGSVLSVVIAVFVGISVAYWVGLVAYAVALASIVIVGRRSPPPEEVIDAEPMREPSVEPADQLVAATT